MRRGYGRSRFRGRGVSRRVFSRFRGRRGRVGSRRARRVRIGFRM